MSSLTNYNIYCFDCESRYTQIRPGKSREIDKPGQCGVCASPRIGVLQEDLSLEDIRSHSCRAQ